MRWSPPTPWSASTATGSTPSRTTRCAPRSANTTDWSADDNWSDDMMLATLALATAIAAQTPTPPAPAAQPDFSKVEIKTTKLGGNFYVLEGQGGAIGVLAGPDGVFMVDSQFAPLTEKIAAAIKPIPDRLFSFMVKP